jgi:hypothetical protein
VVVPSRSDCFELTIGPQDEDPVALLDLADAMERGAAEFYGDLVSRAGRHSKEELVVFAAVESELERAQLREL